MNLPRNFFAMTLSILLPAATLADESDDAAPAIIPRPINVHQANTDEAWMSPKWIDVQLDGLHDGELKAIADYLAEVVSAQTGLTYRAHARQVPASPNAPVPQPPSGRGVLIKLTDDADLGDEGYLLEVGPWAVLNAASPAGLFRGVQTIRQLLQAAPAAWVNEVHRSGQTPKDPNLYTPRDPYTRWTIPCVRIKDRPRYPHRGMLLDCGRHFMTKDFIKRYIDLLAYHKLNVLHWHLTEDQGWRIEIKKYLKLTEIGAWRRATRDSEQPRDAQGRYGGFYTQDDIREIVAYAASRYITVIPEIEMPGHSQAALASYPELSCTGGPFEVGTQWGVIDDVFCAGSDRTFEFLEDVLSEVIPLFPAEYIHIGGDECPKTRWKTCPKCQARIKAEGLKDEHELQSYFIRRIEKFLNGKGRRLIGWDEILEGGLAPNATVQSWRGMNGALAAATSGHDVISSPTSHCYLDYAQAPNPGEPTFMGFLPLERCYQFEPTPAQLTAEQARHVLGLEGNMWTEHAPQALVDRQVFPRLCALAEVGWSPAEPRDWADFQRRMRTHYRRLDALGVTYYVPVPRFLSDGKPLVDPTFTDAFELVLDNPFHTGEIRYTLDGREPGPTSPKFERPIRLTDSSTVQARTLLPTGNASGVGSVVFRKLVANEPVAVGDAQPGLRWAYYEGTWSRLPDFDQLTPAATGAAGAIDLSARRRDDNYALRFVGFLDVPTDGVYTFHVKADDAARVRIGATSPTELAARWDGGEAAGRVWLKPGRHPLTIEYWQLGGKSGLEVAYEGPGMLRQVVPGTVLSHEGAAP